MRPTSSRTVAAVAAVLAVLSTGIAGTALAATCKPDDVTGAVDAAGAALRSYTMQTQPQLQPRLKALAAKKGWPEEGYEEAAFTHLKDGKIEQLDQTSSEILARIDTLGEVKPGEMPDCSRVEGIKAAGVELLAVMKAKNAHVTSKIDAELGGAPSGVASVAPPAAEPRVLNTAPATASAPAPAPVPDKPAAPEKPVATAAKPSTPTPADTSGKKPAGDNWQPKTTTPPAPVTKPALPQVQPQPPPVSRPEETTVAVLPQPPAPPPLPGGLGRPSEPLREPAVPAPIPEGAAAEDEYTIEEIRDASRGFFGDVSTGLASVIEHAFRKSGRPTGYILGNEGGGAFIGGLRYGAGTLYMRRGGKEKIYWHGPSLGFDFGASGTRTIFLVYKLREPDDLYRSFTGIDGSAFAVGGVGITLLAGGNMVLAPIRSGLGLRLGASIGYVRFTPKQTWNPL